MTWGHEEQQAEPQRIEPGKPLGEDAPKLDELLWQTCPNCHTGVLYVTRYDPDALHESGENARITPEGFGSGGGYDVECFKCTFSESRPFNPGEYHGQER